MKIYIETSGGIANLRLRGELDGDRLSPALRQRIERLTAQAAHPRAGSGPLMPDAMEYRIIVSPDGEGAAREIELREGASDEEALETARELQRELVRTKMGK